MKFAAVPEALERVQLFKIRTELLFWVLLVLCRLKTFSGEAAYQGHVGCCCVTWNFFCFLPIQLAEGSNAAYFQLLKLFAYGTYSDYVGKRLGCPLELSETVSCFLWYLV